MTSRVPSVPGVLRGAERFVELENANLDALLGREAVSVDSDSVRAGLSGRVVMVTGAAGSIGAELCRQILRRAPRKLICVDHSETPLFHLQQHMNGDSTFEIVYSVGDITDAERMRQLLLEHEVQIIFHAAAYKHVPMMEANPYEGLKNNVFGMLDLVETAEACGCEDFLLISSDKAVKPSSLMGCTKRLGEMVLGSRPSSRPPGRLPRMRCLSVRFGNVIGSQGSVISTFQEQLRCGMAITVTHPEMTRYFMTIPEAVSLTLLAFTVGEHGDILVLDMGEPVRIVDLARTLIRMSGKNLDEVAIIFTGIRPGEKLSEELFYDSEIRLPTSHRRIMRAQDVLPEWHILEQHLEELRAASGRDGLNERNLIRAKLKQIIPEYEWEPQYRVEPSESVKIY